MSKFRAILGNAWQERHSGYSESLAAFCADPSLLAEAKAEHKRLSALDHRALGCPLEHRCAASAHELKFLTLALSKIEDEMPSKLRALAEQAKTAVAEVEDDAERAINNLQKAKQNAHEGVGKINSVAADINKSAQDLNEFAAQTSNFPPE